MRRKRSKESCGAVVNSKKRLTVDTGNGEIRNQPGTSVNGNPGDDKVPELGTGREDPEIDPNGRLYNVEHPMLNPLILNNIFELMEPTLEEYKRIRLVCKCWRDVTLEEWRSKATIRITEETEVFISKSPGGISAGEFLERFEDPDDAYQLASVPFAKYLFTDLTINMSLSDEAGSACFRFWDKVGPCIEDLHLFKCAFPLHQYMAFEQLLLEKVPNLSSLTMTDCQKVRIPDPTGASSFSNRQAIIERVKKMKEKKLEIHGNLKSLRICGEMPVKLKRLVAKVPNIEELSIRRVRYDANASNPTLSEDDDPELLDVLVMIRNQRTQSGHVKYPLRTLELNYSKILYNPISVRRLLDQVRFPLTTLSVEIKPNQSRQRQQLQPLMEIHSSTLRNLTVFCPPFSNTKYHDTFPFDINMEQLENLVLLGNVTRDFKFLKFMPNLKRLEIQRRCEPISDIILSLRNEPGVRSYSYIVPSDDDMVARTFENGDADAIPATSLKYLSIDDEVNEDNLARLKFLVPNLTSFKSKLNTGSLSKVCELWPEIKHITAGYGSVIKDEAITGWEYKKEMKIKRTEKPCVADLKDLRRFELKALCVDRFLTDKSVTDGFLQMPRLVQVQIDVATRKFSAEAECQLKRHVPICQVSRFSNSGRMKYCPNKANECCRQKQYFEKLTDDRLEYSMRMDLPGGGIVRGHPEPPRIMGFMPDSDSSDDGNEVVFY